MSTTTPKSKVPTLAQIEVVVKIVCTPLLSVLVGWLATVVARYFPGVKVDQNQLALVFIVALAGAVLLTWKWLDRLPAWKTLELDAQPLLGHIESYVGGGSALDKLLETYGEDLFKDLSTVLSLKAVQAKLPSPGVALTAVSGMESASASPSATPNA